MNSSGGLNDLNTIFQKLSVTALKKLLENDKLELSDLPDDLTIANNPIIKLLLNNTKELPAERQKLARASRIQAAFEYGKKKGIEIKKKPCSTYENTPFHSIQDDILKLRLNAEDYWDDSSSFSNKANVDAYTLAMKCVANNVSKVELLVDIIWLWYFSYGTVVDLFKKNATLICNIIKDSKPNKLRIKYESNIQEDFFREKSIEYINRIIKSAPGIHEVDIKFMVSACLYDLSIAPIMTTLSETSTIKNLKLVIYQIGHAVEHYSEFFKKIKNNPSIEFLDVSFLISAYKYRDDILKKPLVIDISDSLADLIRNNKSLKSIKINKNNFTNINNIEKIFEALKVNNTLQSLDLTGCEITPFGFAMLADALKSNHSLVLLDLSHCEINKAGALSLAQALEQNTSLKHLNLTDTKLDKDGMTYIASAIENSKTLESLTFDDDCYLNRENRITLKKGIINNKSLKSLKLTTQNITTISSVIDILRSNNTLTFIEINSSYFETRLDDDKNISENTNALFASILDILKTNTIIDIVIIDTGFDDSRKIGEIHPLPIINKLLTSNRKLVNIKLEMNELISSPINSSADEKDSNAFLEKYLSTQKKLDQLIDLQKDIPERVSIYHKMKNDFSLEAMKAARERGFTREFIEIAMDVDPADPFFLNARLEAYSDAFSYCLEFDKDEKVTNYPEAFFIALTCLLDDQKHLIKLDLDFEKRFFINLMSAVGIKDTSVKIEEVTPELRKTLLIYATMRYLAETLPDNYPKPHPSALFSEPNAMTLVKQQKLIDARERILALNPIDYIDDLSFQEKKINDIWAKILEAKDALTADQQELIEPILHMTSKQKPDEKSEPSGP